MTKAQSPIQYTTNHKYEVVAYSPQWPSQYKDEQAVLKKIFGTIVLDIQHVGSTAIPGMAAKPQLDILIQVQNIDSVDAFNTAMETAGYTPYGDILSKGGRLYSRWKDDTKTVNVHVYQKDSPIIWEYIGTRDYLLAHPQKAAEYARFKIGLYQKYPDDYLKYREYKDGYVEKLQQQILLDK
ncbi:MAG: GrpB family protein [Candidatus Saccharimonadales bacterium]